jgi:1-acyl-sn-glycerol-3-phosphate acyltransferase
MVWALILYPIYVLTDKKIGKYLVRNLFVVVLKICGVKVEVEGLEFVDENEKYLVVSNHQSVFDIPVISANLPLNLRIFAKKELSRIPFFGQMMLLYDFSFVDRKNKRQAVKDLKKAVRLMKFYSYLVFPEGTRTKDGSVGKFKSGAFAMAFETGEKILPIAITGVDRIMKPGQLIVNPGTVKMKVLKPISIETGESRKEIANRLQILIAKNVNEEGDDEQGAG